MSTRTVIIGTGSFIPRKVLTNHDLEKLVDTTDEWIRARTGIEERHIAENHESNSFLATQAAVQALDMAGIRPQELDLILVATMTPDMTMPSVACMVQKELGAKKAGALDLTATCSGFIYALTIADRFIRENRRMKVLVIGSEVLSRRINWKDRTTCVLFGDGAGAAVVTGTREDRGIISTHLHADGTLGDLLTIRELEDGPKGLQFIQMEGREVFRHAVRALESTAWEALKASNWTGEDIDLLISHQANVRIMDYLRERLGLPEEKVFININKYGNTSAASIPIALDEANRAGRLAPGTRLLLVAFGGGFTWGSVSMHW